MEFPQGYGPPDDLAEVRMNQQSCAPPGGAQFQRSPTRFSARSRSGKPSSGYPRRTLNIARLFLGRVHFTRTTAIRSGAGGGDPGDDPVRARSMTGFVLVVSRSVTKPPPTTP